MSETIESMTKQLTDVRYWSSSCLTARSASSFLSTARKGVERASLFGNSERSRQSSLAVRELDMDISGTKSEIGDRRRTRLAVGGNSAQTLCDSLKGMRT